MAQVSIIMAAYNAQSFVHQAITSLLEQTLTDFELIVVDDASTDATVSQIEVIQDDRIKLIKLKSNGGVSVARNRALLECTAPYVAIMDADDISSPDRLEKQINYLNVHSEVVAVGSWLYLMSPSGKQIHMDRSPPTSAIQVMADLFEFGGGVFPGTVIMRTDAVQKIGGYREVFPSSEDLDLLLRMTQFGTVANIPEALYGYRLNPNGITFSSKARRDHYAQQALALWRERQSRGSDSLDDGSTLTDLSVSQGSGGESKYDLKQVLSYFYRQDALQKIKSGHKWDGIVSLAYAFFHQPTERKNWVFFVKVILRKDI